MEPTPTLDSLPRIRAEFPTLGAAMDYAADGVRGLLGHRDRKNRMMLDKLLGGACYDSRRIVNELGYRPVWDLERALPELLQ